VLETELSLFLVSNSGELVKMVQTRWILSRSAQVQRLESWFEDVLKNLGRPFAVERHWHLLVEFTSFYDRFQSPERLRASFQRGAEAVERVDRVLDAGDKIAPH
jgi:hypothetical protein